MKIKALITAALIAAGATTLVAVPAEALSTQVVGFRVGGYMCPEYGVYGISHVYVNGTYNMQADQGFPSNTQVAYTSIKNVPASGASANVIVVYHCKVKVGWWYVAGYGQQISGTRWIYGSGWQPTYTLSL